MPLSTYAVLAGRVEDMRAEGGSDTPHFQLLVSGAGLYRVAVNVLSALPPSELMYLSVEDFSHPILAGLPELPAGITPLPREPGGLALDYIRGNLFDPAAMRPLPVSLPGPDNDLSEGLAYAAQRAIADPDSRVYAFGEPWGPGEAPDPVFGFAPGAGVHDVHMNQGNAGRFQRDDGVWQDGALLFHLPGSARWIGIFLAFQSQSWHTDDSTGHAVDTSPDAAAARLRVVAALVNPPGPAPEAESVTLLNASASPVPLAGWSLLDRLKQAMPLDPVTVSAGEAVRIALRPPFCLGNTGGLITLIDPTGQKVHGVSYTADQVREGWTVVF